MRFKDTVKVMLILILVNTVTGTWDDYENNKNGDSVINHEHKASTTTGF